MIGPEDDVSPECNGLVPADDPADDEFVTDPVDEDGGDGDDDE
jgi:hypothetical protein